jgi:putative spermidine/putrescine transport system ATP-binding protein
MSGLEVEELEAVRGSFRLGPVDLAVPDGSATALLGRSGAGKTTLLRTLAGFLPSARGRIRLGPTSLDRLPPERRGFGFVPPNLGLFPHQRVRENVAYPLRLRGVRDAAVEAARWVDRFQLRELADRFPSQLSSGQQQRVAMARALASGPRALLWDEPLAALDVESRDVLLRLVRAERDLDQLLGEVRAQVDRLARVLHVKVRAVGRIVQVDRRRARGWRNDAKIAKMAVDVGVDGVKIAERALV